MYALLYSVGVVLSSAVPKTNPAVNRTLNVCRHKEAVTCRISLDHSFLENGLRVGG